MTKFCEYMNPFGGVCMQRQAQHQALESELLRYCETHIEVVQRERERTRRLRRLASQSQSQQPPVECATATNRRRHFHATVRSRSEPYLQRSSSRTLETCDSRRFTIVDTSDEGESDEYTRGTVGGDPGANVQWTRSTSSPPRLQVKANHQIALAHETEETGHHVGETPRAFVSEGSFPSPNEQRKRVRVKRIVIPPRFEVLGDSEPATPPKVWYVRLAERVAGEPGNPDDDEYIDIDEPGVATESRALP